MKHSAKHIQQAGISAWEQGFCHSMKAFSLVELTLALGVFAFAVLSMLGLMQGLVFQSSESRHESRATIIASQILGDLNPPYQTQPFVVKASDPATSRTEIDWIELSEHIIDFDGEGSVVDPNDPVALYRARVQVSPLADRSQFAHVTIRVHTPPERLDGESFVFHSKISPRSRNSITPAP